MIHIEVDRGYHPAVVRARPDSAIRLVFHRVDDDPCTERVMFSAPRLERRLTAYGSTTVDLTAQEAGEIRYTCGMGRYSGVIRLEDPPPSWFSAVRRRVAHIGGALAVAVIVAAVVLPIIAALALVDIGLTSALAAGGLALAGLVVIGSWGMGKTGRRQPDASRVQVPDEALAVAPRRYRSGTGR